jgi:hypothetical protein
MIELSDFAKLRIGMSRSEIISRFGEPDLKGGTSRKHQTPCVFRYGRIEFCFGLRKDEGLLFVQEVDEFGSNLQVLFASPNVGVAD